MRGIHDAAPSKFQTYFLERLASVAEGEGASELFANWYGASHSNKVWTTIFEKLLDDPASREPTIQAIQKLIAIVLRDSDEINGNPRADTFRSLLKSEKRVLLLSLESVAGVCVGC